MCVCVCVCVCVKEEREGKDEVMGRGERERFEGLWVLFAFLSTTYASMQVTLQVRGLAILHPSILLSLQFT